MFLNHKKIFIILQQLGKSFMLPIAIMPIAGLLMGIGFSFTNEATLARLGLDTFIHDGTLLFLIFSLMASVGSIIFDNLPLLFAIGVAIGFAKKQKEVAVLSSVIAFIVMHKTINVALNLFINVNEFSFFNSSSGSVTTVLGIPSLQIGVFGGILVGLIVALLHNKYREISLPEAFSFFGGVRFIPIISTFVAIILGFALFLIWPPVEYGIYQLSLLVADSGLIGTFLFATIKRLLIPFGLHHVFYLPFWQTSLGGTAVVGGHTYVGAQNILFAQLADPNTAHISATVTQYFGSEFAVMIFGLPAAMLAIYRNALKYNKKTTKSLMSSAALSSILTGITEPIEFPILFASPLLYIFHAVMIGICNVIQVSLNFAVGCTFSAGLLDLILLGVLPGNDKTSWIIIIPLGIIVAIIYYVVFDFAIKKYHCMLPGQEEEPLTIIDLKDDDAVSENIIKGLGGMKNINVIDFCGTRLRCSVHDSSLVNKETLQNAGSLGTMIIGNAVQIVFGPKVTLIHSNLMDYMNSNKTGILTPDENIHEINSPLTGKIVALEDVPDEAFSTGILGKGIAIEPSESKVRAPCDGTITFIPSTNHAIGFECDDGLQILIHLGIDTVNLNGKGFKVLVETNQHIKKGTGIIELDLDYLKDNAKSLISPIVFPELAEGDDIIFINNKENIQYNDILFKIKKEESK